MKKIVFGLCLSAILALCGCARGQDVLPATTQSTNYSPELNADGNYNILFITVDQDYYFEEYPVGSNYKARELLKSMGTTFEKHYTCSNMSTSSRSVMYTGTHITETKIIDNTDLPWQAPMSEDIITIGDRLNDAGYYSAYKGKFHLSDGHAIGKKPTHAEQQQDALLGYGFADWNAEGDIAGSALEGYSDDSNIAGNRKIINTLQTNGTMLTDELCELFAWQYFR